MPGLGFRGGDDAVDIEIGIAGLGPQQVAILGQAGTMLEVVAAEADTSVLLLGGARAFVRAPSVRAGLPDLWVGLTGEAQVLWAAQASR